MTTIRHILTGALAVVASTSIAAESRTLEEQFLSPSEQQKPLIIWQWMDGMVTREGISRDLKAFKDAGLAGVQNFQIGGPMQMRVGNPENAIGNDNWKQLLRWSLDECARLGLTFGTHNCPGWSSSAYPTVRPEESMQMLVYTEAPLPSSGGRVVLARPEVDPQWDYFEDVAVMAVPVDSTARHEEIVDLSRWFDPSTGVLELPSDVALPAGSRVMRIGQTTNGKTNYAQSPETGRGLECDKLSREAVKAFWDGYPSMVLEVAGEHAGKTFTHFEIDSYEAGGQTWSRVLPDEFQKRKGYDLRPWLPYMAGRLKRIGSEEETARFLADWSETVRDCVAENYYGYMTQLAHEAGVNMLIEPYGTGHQRPFHIIDFERIVRASEGADIATEFWQDPPRWGWKDMVRHEASMRKLGKPLLVAEAFTCWPLRAWQDSPATIKPMCDRAFCLGVNRMMLHAGAANPWPAALPGMSFGQWGTHFVPGQTWWMAGGAKELFGYMARCQALLQQGIPAPEQLKMTKFLTYRRTDGDTEIIFMCNQADTVATDTLRFDFAGRGAEIWNPYTCSRYSLATSPEVAVEIEPFGSRFIVVRPGESSLPAETKIRVAATMPVEGGWSVRFPEIGTIETDSLFSWDESDNHDIHYFSGTALYKRTLDVDSSMIAADNGRLVLSLGEVNDMAFVKVNGTPLPLLWKAPFECDITDVVMPGTNVVEIAVTNLWANRMIGDELEPDDLEWSERQNFQGSQGGCYLLSNPDWLVNGTQRPSKGRKTVGCYKFFTADSPLLPSGLHGPVSLKIMSARE
ncbi:MAG: hypothetical protein K2G35_08245 [Duncaniella sp.]|nr:hypothetical protein [Duncaniella sp.]